MSIDRPVIAQAELLENDTRYEQAFDALLNFMRKLCDRFSSNRLDKMTRFLMKMRERRAGHDGVQVIRDRADVFGDRPFVVIQDDDKPLRVGFDVIKRFVTNSARKSGVACDDHNGHNCLGNQHRYRNWNWPSNYRHRQYSLLSEYGPIYHHHNSYSDNYD